MDRSGKDKLTCTKSEASRRLPSLVELRAEKEESGWLQAITNSKETKPIHVKPVTDITSSSHAGLCSDIKLSKAIKSKADDGRSG